MKSAFPSPNWPLSEYNERAPQVCLNTYILRARQNSFCVSALPLTFVKHTSRNFMSQDLLVPTFFRSSCLSCVWICVSSGFCFVYYFPSSFSDSYLVDQFDTLGERARGCALWILRAHPLAFSPTISKLNSAVVWNLYLSLCAKYLKILRLKQCP